MGSNSRKNGRRRASSRPLNVLMLALVCVGSAGCEGLLDVRLPGEVVDETVSDPIYAQLFTESAVAAFECAFSTYVALSGNLTDELASSGSLEAHIRYDMRNVGRDYPPFAESLCGSLGALHTPMSQARWMADDAIRRLEAATDAEVAKRSTLLATAYAYAGYSYLVFGEGWCSAAFDNGPELLPPAVLALAEARFTKAIEFAQAAGATDIGNMARVGRARTRLDLKNLPGAAADARLVPQNFNFMVTREAAVPTRENEYFVQGPYTRDTSVEPEFWNLTWKGVPDPRVSLTFTGVLARDGQTRLINANKYPTAGTSMRLASWAEAQLILAEAEGGQTALDAVNALHARAGLPAFVPATDGDVMQHVITEERRREIFLEGHRLNDMIRHNLPFQTGANPYNNRAYGNTTCFPLPYIETDNNPNIEG
ncbi:MAG: RagB/SusD family nutrient uptake outer membrane protein [Candidatus Bipolaricaulota bacterium]